VIWAWIVGGWIVGCTLLTLLFCLWLKAMREWDERDGLPPH